MLRPTSEIAVAISVASVREKPRCSASARPSARAGSMSRSPAIGTLTSLLTVVPRSIAEQCQSLLEVERGVQRLEIELELHQRNRHVGADTHDHCLGPAQPRGEGDASK